MSEIGKSFELDEQKEINAVLNEAEEALSSDSIMHIREHFGKVETVANRITASMMSMA